MQDVVNGREAPRWAFKILMMVCAVLIGWFYSEQSQASEVRSLDNRVTSLEAMKPQVDRISRRVDDIYNMLSEDSRGSGRGSN